MIYSPTKLYMPSSNGTFAIANKTKVIFRSAAISYFSQHYVGLMSLSISHSCVSSVVIHCNKFKTFGAVMIATA
jgi:hypothetical protein